jgi:hypothetical protein
VTLKKRGIPTATVNSEAFVVPTFGLTRAVTKAIELA